jgi:hypothetical protein
VNDHQPRVWGRGIYLRIVEQLRARGDELADEAADCIEHLQHANSMLRQSVDSFRPPQRMGHRRG